MNMVKKQHMIKKQTVVKRMILLFFESDLMRV